MRSNSRGWDRQSFGLRPDSQLTTRLPRPPTLAGTNWYEHTGQPSHDGSRPDPSSAPGNADKEEVISSPGDFGVLPVQSCADLHRRRQRHPTRSSPPHYATKAR